MAGSVYSHLIKLIEASRIKILSGVHSIKWSDENYFHNNCIS